ncbi:MAG TPA: excinuclease ABC subunit UvrA [Myxococcota bacterium]|nr:excinuclease ABC subunit UvrA [Myxococcota bacterium]
MEELELLPERRAVFQSEIRIEGARSHNLKRVDCRIPLRRLTVVTGVSGSGKSTLAFDTLYAEGQRRYVASLSTYARQFLERLPRPEVDFISHLPPAISIEQQNRVTNARSTVGSATEILDHLRLLYAKVGRTVCPTCKRPAIPGTVEAVVERMLERWESKRASIGAPLRPQRGESPGALRERLLREGYTRLLDPAGAVIDLSEGLPRSATRHGRELLVLMDRLTLAGGSRTRLAEAVGTAFQRGGGRLVLLLEDGERTSFREGLFCEGCGRLFPLPVPALFSFGSPLGACEACQGFGRIPAIDWERVIPDPTRTLAEGPIVPFTTAGGKPCQRDLLRACRRLGIPTDEPWSALREAQRRLVIEGDGGDWYGVRGFFEWLEGRRYKVQARVLLARYRRYDPCVACGGLRLQPDALSVQVGGEHIGAVCGKTIRELDTWLAGLALSEGESARGGRLLDALRARVGTALRVGLGYLSLSRQTRTLSGGEAQRIQLATALGGTLTSALYVLDEPSIGLHARDVARLLDVLRDIRDQGNTVVVVEHAPEIVAAADHVIDLGPGAGRLGGQVVVEGTVEVVRAHPDSLTGQALLRAGKESLSSRRKRRAARGFLRIVGARANNLKDVSVEIPLGQLVVVSGVSGAGKSTLVRSVLVGHLTRHPERGACERIEGAECVREVLVVDPTPPARSSRSNPATVSAAFEGIRRRFAATREARRRGLHPGWFSFNVPGGRCEGCEGAGEVVVDMQFLDDVRVPCELCDGRRYREDALDIKLDGRSIVDFLALTLAEAQKLYADDPKIGGRLAAFVRVGLGYLTLGQPLSTLSGGENQRLRLALALGERSAAGKLLVLDEPTTGLHPADVDVLLRCLEELLDAGGSVLVIEHNLEVLRSADHVIDLGPEGGPGGGRVVAEGPPEAIASVRESFTGAALRGE